MLKIKFAQILSQIFHAFNLSSWCHCCSFSRSQDQNSSMNHKWIQRRKCGILTSSGWATIWTTKIKILLTFSRQWAAVNSEFRPTSSRFEAPSFIIWLPGSWVNYPITLAWSRSVLALLFCHKTHLLPLILLVEIRQSTASLEQEKREWREEEEEEREEGKKVSSVHFVFVFLLCI